MWDIKQWKNSYWNMNSFNKIRPKITRDTTKDRQFNYRRIFKLGNETQTSKKWDMKWHWLIYKEVLNQLILYWGKGTNKDTEYFTKYHLPINHPQMQPRYIHTSNLVRETPQIISLCEDMLNRVPSTHFWIQYNYLNPIQSESHSMTQSNVRRSNS